MCYQLVKLLGELKSRQKTYLDINPYSYPPPYQMGERSGRVDEIRDMVYRIEKILKTSKCRIARGRSNSKGKK